MEFEWSEMKRLTVLKQRGLDFLRARMLFDGRPLSTYSSPREDELRWVSIGHLDGHMVAVIWTLRGDNIRIITMRRARDAEKRRFSALYG